MLKNCLFGLMLILIVVGAASAQSEWKGFYAGGNIGAALGRSTANTKSEFSPSGGYFSASSVELLEINGRQKLSADAFTGGLEAGINAQSGAFVFGGELDYESFRLNGSQSTTVPYTCCSGAFTLDQSFKTTWLLTARPRAGFVIGSALLYATGGLAVTKVDYQAQFSDTSAAATESASVNKTKYGWTGGFGVAFRGLTEHLSLKGEYLYTDFGRLTMTSSNLTAFIPPVAFPSNPFTHSMALHGHVIRAGVDYHFGE